MMSQTTLKVTMTMPQVERTYRTAFENESINAFVDMMFNSLKKKTFAFRHRNLESCVQFFEKRNFSPNFG